MNNKRNISWSTIIVIFVVLAMGIWIVSQIKHSKAQEEARKKKEVAKTKQAVLNMAAKYNAVIDWSKNMDLNKSIYTVNVESALVRNDGRPVLILASLIDITKQGNKYYLYLDNKEPFYLDIYYIFKSNSKQVKEVMSSSKFTKCAIIALVSSVQKPKFEIESESGDLYVDVVPFSNIFVARGYCLDLLCSDDDLIIDDVFYEIYQSIEKK